MDLICSKSDGYLSSKRGYLQWQTINSVRVSPYRELYIMTRKRKLGNVEMEDGQDVKGDDYCDQIGKVGLKLQRTVAANTLMSRLMSPQVYEIRVLEDTFLISEQV